MNAKKHEQRRRWRNRRIGWMMLNGRMRDVVIGMTPPPGPTQRLAWPRKWRWRAIDGCPF